VRRSIIICAILVATFSLPSIARADFGFVPNGVNAAAETKDGALETQAGSHPYVFTVRFAFNTAPNGKVEGGEPGLVVVDLPPGLVGDPLAVPQCPMELFDGNAPSCSRDSQIGVLRATVPGTGQVLAPIFNLAPNPGVAALLGFNGLNKNALEGALVKTDGGYAIEVRAALPLEVSEVEEKVWGVPADPGHDAERGQQVLTGNEPPQSSDAPLLPFLTLPTSCWTAPQLTVAASSKSAPGEFVEEIVPFQDSGGRAILFAGCSRVPFSPSVAVQPTSRMAESSSGLDFQLNLPNQGLLGPESITESEPRKTVVTLGEGLTVNPSLAEGVGVCSEAQYAAEQIETAPGGGCPEASKIASVVARSPLLKEAIEGSVYLAAPYENPFGTLTALYLVARAPERGVLVKQAGKVDFDGINGQITAAFEDLPPLPYSSFKLHFREGPRAPLVTPASCGELRSVAKMTPFSVRDDTEAAVVEAPLQIDHGTGGGACPNGGTPPFRPGVDAGTVNNAAGSYSPFYLRLSRTDEEQEITHFSIKLPPGVTGKLAGIPFCAEGQIAAAEARERTPHGGQEELDQPSCPQASEVGHTLVGAGVGPSLAYVPGKIYLAGPYNGSNLSIVAITAAKAGPFDLGTVVIREGLKVNPETAEVSVDAAGSDPIPHIIDGIPVHLRDIRVYVDRREFVRNPTDCEPTSTASTVVGSGTDFASEADDRPVTVTSRFQAADCASLGFKPGLKISLKGPTKRAGLPALTAVVTPRTTDANIGKAVVTLPPSEFLEQAHIGNTCTRVQFHAGGGNGEQCPANSVLGEAVAVTPLLSEPLEGRVFLRSNGGERRLPDLVAALHSKDIDIDLVGFIDSLHKKGSGVSRIRTTFATVPDQPVTRFTLKMFGGKKGLLVNSTNLCKGTHKAISEFTGQNGKRYDTEPAVQTQCKKKGKKHAKKSKDHVKGKKGNVRQALSVLHHAGW
jgi:hypothetical protein